MLSLSQSFIKASKRGFAAATLTAGFAVFGVAQAGESKVTLTGAEETPAVTTTATGRGSIVVNADKTVTGSITTQGITGTAAHIHLGAVGQKGPPIITFTKGADGVWTVPAGSTLTDEQLASYKAGNLYINVHSAENKGGEIRGQLKP